MSPSIILLMHAVAPSRLVHMDTYMCDPNDDSDSDAGVRSYEGASTVSTIYPDDSASAVASLSTHHRELLPSDGLKSEKSVLTFRSSGTSLEIGRYVRLTCYVIQCPSSISRINCAVDGFLVGLEHPKCKIIVISQIPS